MRDVSLTNQDFPFVNDNLIVQCLYPILHCHRIHFQCLELGKVQEAGDKQVQTLKFNLRQIVLGNLHVILGHIVTLEVRHAHKWLFIVHAIVDNFRCRILVNGIMQFVLHSGKEHFCHLIAWVIVRGSCINIRNLLIEIAFTTTNIPDALEQIPFGYTHEASE